MFLFISREVEVYGLLSDRQFFPLPLNMTALILNLGLKNKREPCTSNSWIGVYPFTPKSDQHLISPYNITPESRIKATRIKEMITN